MTEVAWLDDEEQQAWRSLIAAYRHLQIAVDGPMQAATGLSSIDFGVLVYLSETPNREARMHALADYVVVSSSQLTYRIDRLVKLGYIERRSCPTDRRGSNAALTNNGLAALETAAAIHVTLLREQFLDHLTRDQFLTIGHLLDQTSPTTMTTSPLATT